MVSLCSEWCLAVRRYARRPARAWECNREARTGFAFAADPEIAAHSARQVPADSEAEACAAAPARVSGIELHERIEHRVLLVQRDSYARVAHPHEHRVRCALPHDCIDQDVTTRARELHGVRN